MIDKSLVQKRFSRSLKTYNENAVVQKLMAKKLISLLPRYAYNSIFEIGSSTGVLTEQIAKIIKFNEFTGNDIVENSKEYIDKIIPQNSFIYGDIEEIKLNKKYDLIISNAAIQWCENPEKVIKNLTSNLKENGVLAVSLFGNNNFKELKTVLNIESFRNTALTGIEETKILYFDTPLEILKHIKSTGANALTEYKFTKSSLKSFEERYRMLYSKEDKVYLTYNPLYIIKNL